MNEDVSNSAPSDAEIEHIARLTRLQITAEEVSVYREQLQKVLAIMETLKGVDTSNIGATAHPLEERNVMRDDVAEPSLSQKDALHNAPRTENSHFKVPAIQ